MSEVVLSHQARLQTQHYRTNDLIQNLRIKVTLKIARRIPKNSDAEEKQHKEHKEEKEERKETEGDIMQEWSRIIHWQEKIFSPQEVIQYSLSSKSRYSTALDAQYREEIRKRGRLGQLERSSVQIFTYVDRDGYVSQEELHANVVRSPAPPTTLAKNVAKIGGTPQDEEEKSNRGLSIQHHLRRERLMKQMYIMAAVDIEYPIVTHEDQEAKYLNTKMHEQPLCCIRVYPNEGLVEMRPGFSPTFKEAAMLGVTMDKREENSEGIARYQFATPNGSIYYFTIENESTSKDFRAEEALLAIRNARDRVRQETQKARLGTDFVGSPEHPFWSRLFVMADIVSASNFSVEQLSIRYHLILPTYGWTFADQGKLNKCMGQTHWSRPINLQEKSYWAIFDFFPMSIFSSLISNVTTSSAVSTSLESLPLLDKSAFYLFGHRFRVEILSSLAPSETYSDSPFVVIEAISRDSWGKHHIEGYGTTQLPLHGMSNNTIKLWKPEGTIRDRMWDYFLGGSRRFENPKFPSALGAESSLLGSDHNIRYLNRLGLKTVTTGSVEIRFQIITQNRHVPRTRIAQPKLKLEQVLAKFGQKREQKLKEAPTMPPEVEDEFEGRVEHAKSEIKENDRTESKSNDMKFVGRVQFKKKSKQG